MHVSSCGVFGFVKVTLLYGYGLHSTLPSIELCWQIKVYLLHVFCIFCEYSWVFSPSVEFFEVMEGRKILLVLRFYLKCKLNCINDQYQQNC